MVAGESVDWGGESFNIGPCPIDDWMACLFASQSFCSARICYLYSCLFM